MKTERALAGKVAIVTGAGRGLGAAIARSLAEAGACVAVNDINPDRADRVASEIRANDGCAIGVMADVSNKFQCVTLVEAARAEWGQLDILVNNANVKPVATIFKMDEWDWDRCLDVNLKGTFLMSQLCGRVMMDENKERGGVIVNIGTIDGKGEGLASYQASQTGIVGFGRACASEFAPYGIRVHTLLGGESPETDDPADQDRDVATAWAGAGLVEWQGPPGEIAEVVLRLCIVADKSDAGEERERPRR